MPERFDQAESAVDQFEARKKWETLQLTEYEEGMDSAQSPAERKQLEDAISNLKSQRLGPLEEQEAQAEKMEVAEQLRIEQATERVGSDQPVCEERVRSSCRRKLMSTSYLILATRPAVGNF